MINAYQLTDAVTAAFFGMFALWAAGSRRHWFVRMAVVSTALLVLLLIPAYEPLIKFGVEVLFVLFGISIWRRDRKRRALPQLPQTTPVDNHRLRISLQTLLLVTVVVAVVTAVAARAPHFAIYEWYEHVMVGMCAALMPLFAVWLVCGKTRWWVRLLAVPPLVYWMALAMYWLWISRWSLQHWITSPSYLPRYWQGIVNAGILSGGEYFRGTICLGLSILCAWLILVRAAGWFDPFHDTQQVAYQTSRSAGWRSAARAAAAIFFGLAAILPLWLLYLLMTPTPVPDLSAPRPNGYDDLLAAGYMIGDPNLQRMRQFNQMPVPQLRETVKKNAVALAKVHDAIQGDCRFPLIGVSDGNIGLTAEELGALRGVCHALGARIVLATKDGDVEEQLAAQLDLLRLTLIEERSSGVDRYEQNGIFLIFEHSAVYEIWMCTRTSAAERCTELALELAKLDAQRISWDQRVAHERIANENSDWESHLTAILDDWAGEDRNADRRPLVLEYQFRLRALIATLAIRAFELQNARLPATLDELVPKYMPAIPGDPFGRGGLKYRVADGKYVLYSVGWNQADDGGTAPVPANDHRTGDLTDAMMFPRPAAQSPTATDDDDGKEAP